MRVGDEISIEQYLVWGILKQYANMDKGEIKRELLKIRIFCEFKCYMKINYDILRFYFITKSIKLKLWII